MLLSNGACLNRYQGQANERYRGAAVPLEMPARTANERSVALVGWLCHSKSFALFTALVVYSSRVSYLSAALLVVRA